MKEEEEKEQDDFDREQDILAFKFKNTGHNNVIKSVVESSNTPATSPENTQKLDSSHYYKYKENTHGETNKNTNKKKHNKKNKDSNLKGESEKKQKAALLSDIRSELKDNTPVQKGGDSEDDDLSLLV